MKKYRLIVALLVFGMIASQSLHAQVKYLVKNDGTGAYLFHDFKAHKVICFSGEDATESAAAVWEVELVGGTSHSFRLKNTADKAGYLYVKVGAEGEPLKFGTTDKKSRAAMFVFQQVDNTSGRIRLKSSAFPDLYVCHVKRDGALLLKSNPAGNDASVIWLVEEIE
jgi:hypothetical protein